MIVTDLDELSVPVKHSENADHEVVGSRLENALESHGGYGLSANQIGIQNSRTCLLSVKEDILLINPRIVDRKGETKTVEGCLSIPDVQLRTHRNVWVTVEADNWRGRLEFGPGQWTEKDEADEEKKRENLNYVESIAVQHEIDHLNGKTIYDREIQREPFEKSELQQLGRNDKVFVENESGERFEVKWKYASKKVGEHWTLLEIK